MNSILILGNKPGDCFNCQLHFHNINICAYLKKFGPDECPLKDLPQKIVGKREMFMPTYSLGWNDCIGTMLGEEEGNNGLKPLKDENHEYYGCPSCRHIVSSVQNYCENCGQKLDWRNVGEIE